MRARAPSPSPARRRAKTAPSRGGWTLLGACGGMLLLAGGYLWFLGGSAPSAAAIGGPFTLTDANGATVTDRSFGGRYLLIYFGYTGCRDVCPMTLTTVTHALDGLGARAGRIQPLFITVDPQRDTPAVLRRYMAAFSPRLVALTGSDRALRQVQREYHVQSVMHPGASGSYDVDHDSVLMLFAPDGSFLAPIAADATSAQVQAALARMVA